MTELLNTYERSFKKNNDIITSDFDKLDLYFSQDKSDSERQITKLNKSNLFEELDKLIDEQQKILK